MPDVVHRPRPRRRGVECPFDPDGLQYEIAEVHRCLTEGLTESPTMPLAETVRLAEAMDDIRAQIGMAYPGERP